MTINRRSVLRGILAGAAGLGMGLSANAQEESGLIRSDINVQDAINFSQDKVVLHCGRSFNQDILQSIKYAIEEIGMFDVEIYGGGPPDMVTSYVFGHNYPGQHYSEENAHNMVEELRTLAAMHQMALESDMTP